MAADGFVQDAVGSASIVPAAGRFMGSVARTDIVLRGWIRTVVAALKCLRPCSREQSAQHDKACDNEA